MSNPIAADRRHRWTLKHRRCWPPSQVNAEIPVVHRLCLHPVAQLGGVEPAVQVLLVVPVQEVADGVEGDQVARRDLQVAQRVSAASEDESDLKKEIF